MGRIRRDFERIEDVKSSRLIVIAAEGQKDKSENRYFKAFISSKNLSNVQVRLLERDDRNSSPQNVKKQLDDFKTEYELGQDDELWAVVDRDRWQNLDDIANQCLSDNVSLCVSNPCFELWLLLHVWTKKEFHELSDEEQQKIFENKKTNKVTYTKKLLKKKLGGYKEGNYNPAPLIPKTDQAIELAKELDVTPDDLWPHKLGTRIYLLIESILRN